MSSNGSCSPRRQEMATFVTKPLMVVTMTATVVVTWVPGKGSTGICAVQLLHLWR